MVVTILPVIGSRFGALRPMVSEHILSYKETGSQRCVFSDLPVGICVLHHGLSKKYMFSVTCLLEFSETIHELFLKYLQGYRDGSKGGIRWFISPLQVG